jgi:hypothetical protein
MRTRYARNGKLQPLTLHNDADKPMLSRSELARRWESCGPVSREAPA